MTECKHYEEAEGNGMKVLVKKNDPDTVIITRKRLLQVCGDCPEQESCKVVRELYKILKF